MIITIDGPAGTGKSTVAKRVAEKLGFTYFNTGATYRSLTWFLLHREIDDTNEEVMAGAMHEFRAEFFYDEKTGTYRIGEQDITEALHSLEVTERVSQVALHPYVRCEMMPIQRDFAAHCANSVFEGRDIGTVVFPRAEIKIFLTATAETRAERRLKERQGKGESATFEEVLASIKERDHRDMTRKVAPLKQAEDAALIDTSHLSIEEVVEAICEKHKAVAS